MKKIHMFLLAVTAMCFAPVQSVFAALPAAASAAFTSLETDGLALIDLVWPVVAAVTIGFVLIKLFRRGANKV